MTISAAFANTWRDEKGRFADKGYVAADGGLVDIGDLDGELVEKSTIAELVEAYDLYENKYGPVKMNDGASLYALPGEYGEQVRYVALAEEEEGTYLEIYDDFYDVAYDIDISAQESDVYDDFLSQAKRTIVFHGTRDQDSFDSIKEGGLGTRNETRAPGANDFVGSAVFTTSNEHVAYEYGADTFVFEIDLPQAIADGVITTDNLSREPGIDEAEALSGVAYGYGDAGFNAYDGFSGMGIDEATIIISTDIPPKYLKPYGNAESLTVKSSVSFLGDTASFTINRAIEFANTWRDELGRFAPKGYQIGFFNNASRVVSGVPISEWEKDYGTIRKKLGIWTDDIENHYGFMGRNAAFRLKEGPDEELIDDLNALGDELSESYRRNTPISDERRPEVLAEIETLRERVEAAYTEDFVEEFQVPEPDEVSWTRDGDDLVLDGKPVRLVGGTSLPDAKVATIMSSANRAVESDPYLADVPVDIKLVPIKDPNTLAFVKTNRYGSGGSTEWRTIHLHENYATSDAWTDGRTSEDRHDLRMGSSNLVESLRFTVQHEMAHVSQFEQARNMEGREIDTRLLRAAQTAGITHKSSPFLSAYGHTSTLEAGAEAFAEWANTGGMTNNPIVQAYANEFGWTAADSADTTEFTIERPEAYGDGIIPHVPIDDIAVVVDTFDGPEYQMVGGTLVAPDTMTFANEWRDEIGRFAPKGYTAVSSGVLVADAETLLQARNKAQAMMSAVPQPSQTAVIAHQADALLAREGWIRAGGERRGNSTKRAERLQEMADLWGDGEVMPCVHTGIMLAGNKEAALKYGLEMAQQDKLIVGPHGGGYTIDNLVPSSRAANQSRGDDTPDWLGQPEWGDPAVYASATSTANSRKIALQFQKRRKAIRSRRRDKGKSVSAPKGKLWDTKWRGEEFEPAGPQPEVSGDGDGGGVDADVVDKYGFVGGAVDRQGGDRSGDWGRVDDVGEVGGFGVSEGQDSLVGKRSVPSERFAGGGCSVGDVHGGHDSSFGVRRAVQFANTWRDEMGRFAPKGYTATEAQAIVYEQARRNGDTPEEAARKADLPDAPRLRGDRTGDAKIDAVIDGFLDEPLGDYTTDDTPIGDLTKAQAHGMCQEVAEQFVEYAEANGLTRENGYRVYATHTNMDEIGYETQGVAEGEVMDDDGNIINGYYYDHTINSIYTDDSRFPHFVDFTARQYGYDTPVKVSFSFTDDTVELAASGVVQFANPWRDELGRFAPKGYTVSDAGVVTVDRGDSVARSDSELLLPSLRAITMEENPINDNLRKALTKDMARVLDEPNMVFDEQIEAMARQVVDGSTPSQAEFEEMMAEITTETFSLAERPDIGEISHSVDADGRDVYSVAAGHTFTIDPHFRHEVVVSDDQILTALTAIEMGHQITGGDPIHIVASHALVHQGAESNAVGWVDPYASPKLSNGYTDPPVNLSTSHLLDYTPEDSLAGATKNNWAMPSSYTTHPTIYWALHEVGHVLHYRQRLGTNPPQPFMFENASYLSKYGRKSLAESYAETFAEWVNTGGSTSNPAVHDYANHYGWATGSAQKLYGDSSTAAMAVTADVDWDRVSIVADTLDGPLYILDDGTEILLGDDESARFTIDGSVQFANPWRDEIGRFAPKGYQYGPAAVGLTAGVGRGEGWDIRDGEYVVSARDRDGNVVWSDDMDLSVYFTSGMRKYRNAIEVANVMEGELADALVTELEGIQFDDLDSFLFMETSNYLRDSGLATTEGLSMAAAFQIAAWRQASGTAEIGSWDDADTISGLLGAGNISEAQEAITALYGITPQSGFIAAVNNGWAASSTSYSSLALQLHASGGKRDQLSWLSDRSGADVLDKAARLSYQMSDSFFAAARAYEDHSLNTMQALGVGDRMELWRGVRDSGMGNFVPEQNAILINTNPLSSWSTMYSVACCFGSTYSGAVYGQKIDPWYGKVFSFGDTTGLGAHGEWEVVMKQTDGPFRPGAIVGTEGGVFPNSPPDIVEFVAEGEPVVIHVDAVDPDWLDNWEQAVDFDDAEDAGRAEWWAKVVEGRMAGDRRPPSELAVHGSVAFANTWRDEIGRFAPKGYQASISGSDLAGMTIDGEHGRITFEANGDGTYRLLYDIEQATGEDGADVEMNVAVELDENGDIVAIEAVLADRPGRRDYKDSDVEEVVRLLEEEFTGAGAELMAPDYRERSTLDPDFDEIDAQPIPDDGDFAAMLVHELYGFEHRGERYRFDIQSAHEGWVKFDIVDDYGATVAEITRGIGETSMQNERFFMADEFQNQGIGTKFLDGFEAAVHERYDIATIGLEAVSVGRYAWASRGFEKIGGFDSTAEDWLEGMRDHVSSDAGKLSKLDVIEDSWRNYGDGVYPGELIGVDRDAAHDVLTSGRNWHGEKYVGSNLYTNWEKEFLSRPENIIVPHGQDRPEQIPGQGELFASLTIDGSVQFANTWRDERGRFAPKGYVPSISTLIDNWTVDHNGEPTREAWALKHYGAIAVAGTMDYEMKQSLKRNLEGKTLGDEDLRGFTAELTNTIGPYYGGSEAVKSMPLGLAMQLYAFDSYVRSSNDVRNTESVAGALDKFIANPTYENEQQISFALEENYGITVESAAVNYVNRGWQQSSVGHIAGPTQIAWSFYNDRVNGVSMDGALASMNRYMSSGPVDALNRTSRTLHSTLSAVAVSNQRYTRQVLDTHLDPDATISLHRAMKTSVSKDMTGVQSNPLSSWTTDFDMAHTNFSGFVGKGGGTMTADVPRQHIMSIATVTGMGSQKESEVIVSGEAIHSVVGVEMKLMADDVVIFVDDPNVSGPDWIKQVDGVSLTMNGGVELSLGGEVTDTHDDPYVDPVLANRMARLWTEAYATFANTMAIELAATHTPLSSPLTASASSPMSWSAIVDEILADGLGDAFYDALVGVNVEIGFDIRDAVVERTVSDIIEHVRAFEPSIRKSTTKWLQKSLRDGLSVDAAVAALPTDSPLSPRQAYLTARTELIAASNNGAYLGYLEAGVKSKTWITARDERVREPTHTDMEGKKVDLRTDFLVDGFAASYPGDPRLPIQERIQCRCTIVPSFEPNGKKAITKKELYAQAVKREISGRSRMNKPQLQQALAADVALDVATMAQLHIISRARNIVGRYGMRKAELLAAIRAS